MKIIIIHNRYAITERGSGEEVMVDTIINLLKQKGHIVVPYIRSSLEIQRMSLGKLRAFFNGIYNVKAKQSMQALLARENPDLVFAQNVYPLISPSVLVACREHGVPVIMRCPNYRLICPNGLFMSKGEVCERCLEGREYWCILRNCENDIFKSMGYALRGYVARRFSLFKNNVDVFLVLTEFARKKLINNGFNAERIQVISGLADITTIQNNSEIKEGKYIAFVGRISSEKGIDIVLKAAKMLPDIPFKIAGKYETNGRFLKNIPENVQFLGQLSGEPLVGFYENAKIIVIPSKWYEGLPVVAIEAMLKSKPIVCSRIGGLPEVVEDGVTGLLFDPDNVNDFSEKVNALWNNLELCQSLGLAGREKAEKEYSTDAFYKSIINAYKMSIQYQK